MKKFWVILFSLIVFLGLGKSLLAEDNNISGVAPTQNTDGSALTDLANINIYHKLDNGVYSLLVALPFDEEGGTFTYLHSNQGQGVHCYKATAVDVRGNESDFSNEACKVVDTLAPGAPSGLTVR